MRNYVQPGKSIDFTAGEGETYVSGQGYVKGSIFGVAANSAAAGQTVTLELEGVYEFDGAGSFGDAAFWDDAGKDVAGASAAGLFKIGSIVGVNGSKRQVRLNGSDVSAVAA